MYVYNPENHYALYMELFTTSSVDRFMTFYEAINLSHRDLCLTPPHQFGSEAPQW